MCVQTSLGEISLAQMRVLALMNVRGTFTQIFGRGVGPGKAHVWDLRIEAYPTPPLGTPDGATVTWTADTLVKQVEDADWLPKNERLPKRSYEARKSLLESPEGAITYMAAAMNAAAHIARSAGFPSIRQRPDVLTFFWQKKDLNSWQQHLAGKSKGTDFGTGPDPAHDMDLWVKQNLRYLEDAVGTPQVPDDSAIEPVTPVQSTAPF
jgi:hypothetical protein